MEKKFCVYCHISPSGKKYIGITSRNPQIRWDNGYGYKQHNQYFWNAIRKYGWKNFKHEILFDGLSKEEASKVEVELISKYKTTNPMHGYNFARGGFGGGHPTSEITKEKISKANRGRACKEETKKRLSELNKGIIPTNLDDLHIKNMKSVDQFDLDGNYIATYCSIKHASEKTKANMAAIGNCCNGRYRTAGGYVWKFSA